MVHGKRLSAVGVLLAAVLGLGAPGAVGVTAADAARRTTTVSSGTHHVDLHGDVVAPRGTARARRGLGGRAWPTHVIRYWADVPDSYLWSVVQGAEAWNRTGVRMRFVRSTRARSNLTISIANIGFSGGLAVIGYTPVRAHRWVHLSPDLMGPSGFFGSPLTERKVYALHIVAHELGHTLGLEHRGTECGLMGPTLNIGSCPLWTTHPGTYQCQVVDKTDLRFAVQRYGGTATLGPKECPIGALPPAVSGVQIAGGGLDGSPAQVTWTPPASVPAGTKVEVLVAPGTTCQFGSTGNLLTPPRYVASLIRRLLAPSTGTMTFPAPYNNRSFCFGVRSVNSDGAGGSRKAGALTLYVPQPGPPTVHWVRTTYSEHDYGQYYALVDPPAGLAGATVLYGVGPQGACPTSYDAGTWQQAWDDGTTLGVQAPDTAGANPCFSFVVIDRGRVGVIASFQTGSEAPPSAPVVPSVTHTWTPNTYGDSSYVFAMPSAPPFGQEVLALARPAGACAPATWPADEDPHQHLVPAGDAGWEVPGYDLPPQACVTVYLVDGQGRIGPGTAAQAPVVPVPAAPVLGVVDTSAYEEVTFHATYAAASTALWATVVDGCPAAWPADQTYDAAYSDGAGGFVVDYYALEMASPMLVVAARNVDGAFGPVVCTAVDAE